MLSCIFFIFHVHVEFSAEVQHYGISAELDDDGAVFCAAVWN